jgi:hypothetical protein
LIRFVYTQINGFFQSKFWIFETGDMRVSEKYQKYRYAKKTQISLDPKKYRYVGDINGFVKHLSR